MNFKKGAWRCFGQCDTGGNAIDLVAAIEDVSFREAALLMVDWFDLKDSAVAKLAPRAHSRRTTRPCLPGPPGGSVRGRMLLARMPGPLRSTEEFPPQGGESPLLNRSSLIGPCENGA